MLDDPYSDFHLTSWTSPRAGEKPADTLGESRIARALESRVATFAHSKLVQRIARANWDNAFFYISMLACFAAGLLVDAYIEFARVMLWAGGCR
jgi:hypothetical protein